MEDDRELAPNRSEPAEAVAEQSAPRRVYRSRDDRVFGGVCAGVARALDLDQNLVRALTVLGCFVGGASFVGYALAMFLLPGEPRRDPSEPEPEGDPLVVWGGFALLALGAFLASRLDLFRLDLLGPSVGAIAPALLIGLATMIVVRRQRQGRLSPAGYTRPRRDRLIFGVASGFARHADIDINLVRVALGIAGVWTSGLVVLLYALLAVFIPTDET